jgi:hypothetical protein
MAVPAADLPLLLGGLGPRVRRPHQHTNLCRPRSEGGVHARQFLFHETKILP